MRPSYALTLGALAGLSAAFPTPNAGASVAMSLDTRSFWKRVVQDGPLNILKRQNTCQVSGNGYASASSSSGPGCTQGNLPSGWPSGWPWPSGFPSWMPSTVAGNPVTTGSNTGNTTVGNPGVTGTDTTLTNLPGIPAEFSNLKTPQDVQNFVKNSNGKYSLVTGECSASSSGGSSGSSSIYNIQGVCFKQN